MTDVRPKNRETYNYSSVANDSTKFYNGAYTSPVNTTLSGPRSPVSHSHPSSRIGSISQSPRMVAMASPIVRQGNGAAQPVIHSEPLVTPNVRGLEMPQLNIADIPWRRSLAEPQILCLSRASYLMQIQLPNQPTWLRLRSPRRPQRHHDPPYNTTLLKILHRGQARVDHHYIIQPRHRLLACQQSALRTVN